MRYKIFYTFLIIILSSVVLFSQDERIIFYEFITNDSAKIFFNENFRFTEKKCAEYIRYVKTDTNGLMNGDFKDLDIIHNRLLGTGSYVKGKKDGLFKIYYQNGTLKSTGYYRDDKPTGKWDFFYQNGQPEREIEITEKDTLLIKFFDKKRKIKVIDGNGYFKGYVAGTWILAKGKVVNGKPDGMWTSSVPEYAVYCKEKFSNGKLIYGYSPHSLKGFEKYYDMSFLNKFFIPNYITTLENYSPQKCKDYNVKNYSFDIAKFNSFLKEKIDRVVRNELNMEDGYFGFEKKITIQFSVNNDGKAEKFSLITGWGREFLMPLSSVIQDYTIFSPDKKIMYFHLKLKFPSKDMYQYNFYFSDNRTF